MKKTIFSILAAICCSVGLMAQDTPDYLSFTATGNSVTISMATMGAPNGWPLEYRLGQGEWTTFTPETTSVEIAAGATAYFRTSSGEPFTTFPNSGATKCWKFVMVGDGTIAVGGNAMSLYDQSCASLTIPSYGFTYLFNGCLQITSVSENLLPATTLNSYCYYHMFDGCTNLTNAPKLPCTAFHPASSVYANMFDGCSSLQVAPELPATQINTSCYKDMFKNCQALTTAPNLPGADRWGDAPAYCYQSMFEGCINLVNVPETLPIEGTGYSSCYQAMFKGCGKIVTAPEIRLSELSSTSTSNLKEMFYGCTSLKHIKVALTTWGDCKRTADWLNGAYNGTDAVFEGPAALIEELTSETVARNCSTVLDKWQLQSYVKTLVLADNISSTGMTSILNGNLNKQMPVQIGRTFQAGMWNTICLPFALDAGQIATVFGEGTQVGTMTRAEVVNEELILGFNTNVTTMDAGYPYIILLGDDENVVNPTFEGVTITTTEAGVNTSDDFFYKFVGTFSPVTDYTPDVDLYLGTGNTVHPISGGTLNGFRAYFELNTTMTDGEEGNDAPADAPTRIRLVINGAEETTAMDEMEVLNPAEKMIENGQVVIIKNGAKYNVFGQQL